MTYRAIVVFALTCFALMFQCRTLAGGILYIDRISLSDVPRPEGVRGSMALNLYSDWNCLVASNSLVVAFTSRFGSDWPFWLRPDKFLVLARYDFTMGRGEASRAIDLACCFRHRRRPSGFCLLSTNRLAFSMWDAWRNERDDSVSIATNLMIELSGKIASFSEFGTCGAAQVPLSAMERGRFPDDGGFMFLMDDYVSDWALAFGKGDLTSRWKPERRFNGYTCFPNKRIVLDVQEAKTIAGKGRTGSVERRVVAHCYRLSESSDGNLSAAEEKGPWPLELHGLGWTSFDMGHDLWEGREFLYDFCFWKIWRMKKTGGEWQVCDLDEVFRKEREKADRSCIASFLHRTIDSCYYGMLFESKASDPESRRYRLKVVEVSDGGGSFHLWSFPDFDVRCGLAVGRLSGYSCVIHRLADGTWVFLSVSGGMKDGCFYVQRMTGDRFPIDLKFSDGKVVDPMAEREERK